MKAYLGSSTGSRLKGTGETLRTSLRRSEGDLEGLWSVPQGPGDPLAGPAAELGLSLLHTCTPGQYRFTLACGGHGALIQRVVHPRPSPGCKRGKVRCFSRAAAARLRRAVDSVDRRCVVQVWFVTCTVRLGEVTWDEFEKVRRRYDARMIRRWGKRATGVWKKEPQKSGNPHLHLMLMWLTEPPSITEFREWHDAAWLQCVQGTCPAANMAICEVKEMRSWFGAQWYCAKYLEKMQPHFEGTRGKLWGYFNRKCFPRTWHREILPQAVGVRMVRVCRKLQERRRRWLVRATVEGRAKWVRFHPRKRECESVDEVAEQWRSMGIAVRRAKRAVLRRRSIKLWSVDEDSGRVECHGEERESILSSWHSIESQQLLRLRDFLVKQFTDDGGIMPVTVPSGD